MQLKSIRFNLKFNQGNGEFALVHSLADLVNKLNIDDLYDYYKSGQLARWLEIHEESEKAIAVKKINREVSVYEQIKALFMALDFQLEPDELKKLIDAYYYPEEIKINRISLNECLNNVDRVVAQEFDNYTKLLKEIIASAKDFSVIKAKVRGLLTNYSIFFELDYMRFYDIMARKCPLAIFTVLMDNKYRKYFLPTDEPCSQCFYGPLFGIMAEYPSPNPATAFQKRREKLLEVSKDGCNFSFKVDGVEMAKTDLFSSDNIIKKVSYDRSGGEWEDAIERDSKIMILYCSSNITIRQSGDKANQYKGNELPEKFMIFDGLDFRCSAHSSSTPCLLYLEVGNTESPQRSKTEVK